MPIFSKVAKFHSGGKIPENMLFLSKFMPETIVDDADDDDDTGFEEEKVGMMPLGW